MMEFLEHLEFYASYPWAGFSKLVPAHNWGDKGLAKMFLQKYWLHEKEYSSVWKPIQDKIFGEGQRLPEMVFKSDLSLMAFRGGCLFLKEDFTQLQKAMHEMGEEYFVVIQLSQAFTEGEPMFKMKFPVNISWEELGSGNYISAVLLEMSLNEYYVFGESGNWGKYAANDHDFPLDIFGFKPELAPVFQKHFEQSKEEQAEIRRWLPAEYKELIK